MKEKKMISPEDRFKKKMLEFSNVFRSVAAGDYSVKLDMPATDDEFAELHCGIKLMLDSVRESLEELNQTNNRLLELTNIQALALEEVESLAHIGSWEWNITNDRINWSAELSSIFEIGKGQNSGYGIERIEQFIHPDDKEFMSILIGNSIKKKNTWDCFHRIITKYKKTKIVHSIGESELDLNGKIVRVYGTIQDVTEIKLTQQELERTKAQLEKRVSERTKELQKAYGNLQYEMKENQQAQMKQAELAAIVESSSEAIIGKTLDGFITSWNKGAERIYGYTAQEIIGKHISTIVPKNKLGELKQVLKIVKSKEKLEHFETTRIRKDGTPVYLDITFSLIKAADGKVTGISSFGIDISDEVKIRHSLEASEINYKLLVETMNDGVILVDNNETIRFVNNAFLDLFGFNIRDVIDKPINRFVQEPPRVRGKKNKSRNKSNEKLRHEMELKTKGNEKFWVLIRKVPVYSASDERKGFIYLITDIDLRKKYEEKLNSVAKFSLENPNPTLRYSLLEEKFIFYNKSSRYFMAFIKAKPNKSTLDSIIGLVRKAFENDKTIREEIKIGKQTFQFTFVPVKEGNYVNLFGNDITATKNAETEIKRLLFVLSQTDNSVVIADKNGSINWVNEGFEKLTGYSLKEMMGTHGETLRHGKKTGLHPENPYYKKMLAQKQSVSYEAKNYKKDGTEYWSFTTITPVLDQNGEIDGIVAIDSDISIRKKAEKQMFMAMQLSEESAKAKQSFLANMSHEIRTPMNVIMGIVQLLRDTPLNEEQTEYLNSMDFAGENLLSIVNDVLDISKIDSGKMTLEKIEFNLHDLVTDLINSIGYRAKEKGLMVNVEFAQNVPSVLLGDPVRLNQILINLISNSIKFTDQGEIKLKIDSFKSEKNLEVRFTVSDTGIGILPEKQQLIFEEFEQAHTGNKRKYGGTGLGLSIVKKLVDLQNGKVDLKSTFGKGTEFTVTLPYEEVNSTIVKEKVMDEVMPDKSMLQGKKMLMVEDNKLNQMVADKFLKSMGIIVTIANNGMEALKILESKNFDAILMDIQMPEMDGYETTRFIRSHFPHPKNSLPILAMTAHALIGEEKKCIDAGMTDYISKPLKKEALERILIKIFNKYGPENRKNEILTGV